MKHCNDLIVSQFISVFLHHIKLYKLMPNDNLLAKFYRRCWRKPVHFVCSLCGVLVVVLNRRKLACVLVGVFVLVFSSCCYEVYLAGKQLLQSGYYTVLCLFTV